MSNYTTAVPNWRPGDTIPLGAGKSYTVIDVKPHLTLSGVLVVTASREVAC